MDDHKLLEKVPKFPMNKTAWLTLFVCLLALILTAMNFWLLPLGDGRDELAHLQVIDFYQQQHRFPLLPDDWVDSSIQAHQPPLYYALMAGLIEVGIIPEAESHSRYTENVFSNVDYYSDVLYNRPAFLQDLSGWDKSYVRSWLLLRLVSLLINGVGVYFCFRAGRLFFSEENQIGVPLSLALLVLAPGYLQTIVALNNNNMLFLWSALATWLLIRTLRLGLDWKTSLGLGIVFGLGMLTKLYMLPLVVAAPLVYFSLPRREWRKVIPHLLLIGLLAGIIAGWWYWRNQHLYGDVSAANQSELLLGTHRMQPLSRSENFGLLKWWGGKLWLEVANAYMTIGWLHAVSYILSALFGLGLIALRRGRLQELTLKGSPQLIFGVFLPAFALGIYGANRNLHGDQIGHILRSALPSLCLYFAVALLVFVPTRYKNWVGLGGIAAMAALALYFQFGFFLPQYPILHRTDDPSSLHVAQPLNIDFENGARLLGVEVEDHHLHPGEETWIKVCWEARAAMDQNYAVTLQLVLPDQPTAALLNGHPLSGRYPTSQWKVGTAFCERIPLRVESAALTPRAYDLRVGMFIPDDADVNYLLADGTRSNYLIVDKIGVTKPGRESEKFVQTPVGEVGNFGILLNYEADKQGNRFTLKLEWEGEAPASADYHYYLHVLDAEGNLVAQLDEQPLKGIFPTRFWVTGARFEDSLQLAVPADAASYVFGLYDPQTGQRAEWKAAGDGLTLELAP